MRGYSTASDVHFVANLLVMREVSLVVLSETNVPERIGSSTPNPLLSFIHCILGLARLCRVSQLQAA